MRVYELAVVPVKFQNIRTGGHRVYVPVLPEDAEFWLVSDYPGVNKFVRAFPSTELYQQVFGAEEEAQAALAALKMGVE